jgi:hypothetical protein
VPVGDPEGEFLRFDFDLAILNVYLDMARADDSLYRQRAEMRRAEEKVRLERRERMRAIAKHKRHNVAKRPWQAAGGFKTKQEWVDAGSPGAAQAVTLPETGQGFVTRREKVEARLRLRKR